MTNVGDHVVKSTASGTPWNPTPITGAIGLSSWATSVAYDDVRVTAADGRVLFSDDFSGDAAEWTGNGTGAWGVVDGRFVQSDTAATNPLMTAGDPSWNNFTVSVKATKLSGSEGFLIPFAVNGSGNPFWWNLGGWNNTRSAVDGGNASRVFHADDTRIETGRTYDLRIEVRDRTVRLFVDGQLWAQFADDGGRNPEPFRQVVTRDQATGELIVKVVNAQGAEARTKIDLGAGTWVLPNARATVLEGMPDDVNTEFTQPVRARQAQVRVSNSFTHTFPPNSVTFLRIKDRRR